MEEVLVGCTTYYILQHCYDWYLENIKVPEYEREETIASVRKEFPVMFGEFSNFEYLLETKLCRLARRGTRGLKKFQKFARK